MTVTKILKQAVPWAIGIGVLVAFVIPMVRPAPIPKSPSDADATESPTITIRKELQNLHRNPNDIDAHARLAVAYALAGNNMRAISESTIVAGEPLADIKTAVNVAGILNDGHQFDDAEPAYKAVLQRDPDNADALGGLAAIYLRMDWVVDAERLVEPAWKRHPKDPQLCTTLGIAYAQGDEFGKAAPLLEVARTAAASTPKIAMDVANVYILMKKYDDAMQVARDGLTSDPENPTLQQQLAQAMYLKGDAPGALGIYSHLASQPKAPLPIHYGLAQCYQRLGRTADEVAELEQVYHVMPAFQNTRTLLAAAYTAAGRQTDAARMTAEAEKAAPDLEAYTHALYKVSHEPDNVEAHKAMAEQYRLIGRKAERRMELYKVTQLAPHDAAAKKAFDAAPPDLPTK